MDDYTAGLKCAMGPLCERVSVLGKLLQRPPRVRGRGTLYSVYAYIHAHTLYVNWGLLNWLLRE